MARSKGGNSNMNLSSDDDSDEEHPASRKRSAGGSDDDSDAEGGESDDDSIDAVENSAFKSHKKKPRKEVVNNFIDEEAEANSSEDDEHYDPHDRVKSHYTEEDIARENLGEMELEIIRQQNIRRQAQGGLLDREDVDDLEHAIEERYRENGPPGMGSYGRPTGLGGGLQSSRGRIAPIRIQQDKQRRNNRRLEGDGVERRRDAGRGAPSSSSRKNSKRRKDSEEEEEEEAEDVQEEEPSLQTRPSAPFASPDAPAMVDEVAPISQQALLPSVSDPSLWMIKCKPGNERALVIQIMNRAVSAARRGVPPGITAVIAGQTKGAIFIESMSEPAVQDAVQGVRDLRMYTMTLVPLSDMTTVLTVTPQKKPVAVGDWVRMNRGHYKGDIAKVIDVREGGFRAVIQAVPRIDLAALSLPQDEARARAKKIRPPQKFFNGSEIMSVGDGHNYDGDNEVRRERFPGGAPRDKDDFMDFFQNNYYQDGYLIKDQPISTLKTCGEDDPPTLDELQQFRRKNQDEGRDNDDDDQSSNKRATDLLEDLAVLQSGAHSGATGTNAAGLLVGDTVEVVEGDLIGMRGKVISIGAITVKVRPVATGEGAVDSQVALGEVEFLTSQLMKYIPVGCHVKVTDGRYTNETGTVVAVEKMEGDWIAVLLTDMTNKEIQVRTSQLQESAEISSGQDKLQGYELHDLVCLSGGGSNTEVGVIVHVGREEFSIINNHGIVRDCRPEELRGKRNTSSRRAVALDLQGNQIRVGDSINVTEGTNKGKSATIKHMNRAQLFLYSQTKQEHAGIFVVRSRSCVL
eukprot:CAMPEP_0113327840 /NCGR_PEP_ID=MMETSP0010_2-20120614/19588_1 /TAXON_ID=216773 ORGANISM="Corethron hystrix, Strain 308" /NCGR_SAMPLE_ID=MMETSP0010_2 /ASSEMBLY_ACC=CAM_ASM_000155 /LENGTH=799 /DNA_ID=CAMNT_0000188903 /DNA_START=156 /DNA_END=2551 /DNA_ORIENTATION=+ /assembly_acc=CAM_ASM_000155